MNVLKGLGDYIAWSVLAATVVSEIMLWGSAMIYYATDEYWRRVRIQRAGLDYERLKRAKRLDEAAPRQRPM